jgi:hypothetical protein
VRALGPGLLSDQTGPAQKEHHVCVSCCWLERFFLVFSPNYRFWGSCVAELCLAAFPIFSGMHVENSAQAQEVVGAVFDHSHVLHDILVCDFGCAQCVCDCSLVAARLLENICHTSLQRFKLAAVRSQLLLYAPPDKYICYDRVKTIINPAFARPLARTSNCVASAWAVESFFSSSCNWILRRASAASFSAVTTSICRCKPCVCLNHVPRR